MGSLVLSGAKAYVGGYDMSGDLNGIALKYGADLKDATSIADSTRQRRPGLKDVGFQLDGYWNGGVGNVDDQAFNSMVAVNDVPITLCPIVGAEGEIVYTFKADTAQYAPGAKVGDMFAFSVQGGGDADLVRATMMQNSARTVTGTGTIMQLGAVSALQKLWAALHIVAVSGAGTIVAKVQSAALIGFGSPTDRITFSSAAAVGSQWAAPVAGAITDQFWRVTWTITGFTSVTFAVPVGIQ